MDCSVCCEKMAKSVDCLCGFSCCRTCIRTYLSEQIQDPHCMSCKKVWEPDMLGEVLGKTYTSTTFKKIRADVYVERINWLIPKPWWPSLSETKNCWRRFKNLRWKTRPWSAGPPGVSIVWGVVTSRIGVRRVRRTTARTITRLRMRMKYLDPWCVWIVKVP